MTAGISRTSINSQSRKIKKPIPKKKVAAGRLRIIVYERFQLWGFDWENVDVLDKGPRLCTGRKNGFAQICSLHVSRKFVETEDKSGAKMVNDTFALLSTPPVFLYAKKEFSIFASCLILRFYKFATCLQGANLYKSIFCPVMGGGYER